MDEIKNKLRVVIVGPIDFSTIASKHVLIIL
jgi:hypothetical protein